MFSRRNRGFIGTCFILIAIVLFGYGLYMYDLKSVKLTESEAQRHHLQRSEKKINEKLDKIKGEKKTLESELENVSLLLCLNWHHLKRQTLTTFRLKSSSQSRQSHWRLNSSSVSYAKMKLMSWVKSYKRRKTIDASAMRPRTSSIICSPKRTLHWSTLKLS